MLHSRRNQGFTLIEAIIYIGLFAIIIGGGMVAAYQIIQSTEAGNNHLIIEEEANFLLRKLDWALTGASAITPVASPPSLIVTKSGFPALLFDFSSPNLRLKRGSGAATILNSQSIAVSNLSVSAVGSNGVTIAFTLTSAQEGKTVIESFATTKYIRQ